VDFTLWVKALVIENTFALPWNWFSSLVVETP